MVIPHFSRNVSLRCCTHVALLLSLAVASTACQADVFYFKDGRVIEGTVHPTSADSSHIVVELANGSYAKILQSDLKRNGHDTLTDFEKEYAKEIGKWGETADGHHALAGWCKSKGMVDLAKAHYRRALDIDPNHSDSRVAAGYDKDENGRWVKKEVIMGERRGKVRLGRVWRFPESIVIEKQEDLASQKLNPIKKELSRWNANASSNRSSKARNDAIQKLRGVQDPNAVPIIAEMLLRKRNASPPDVRLVHVQILSRFKNPIAAQALASASLNDADRQVRNASLDALRRYGSEFAVPQYIAGLSSSSNTTVNMAADGLAQFNPPQAILPLIYALNTEHVQQAAGNGNAMNLTGPNGLSMGGSKTVTVSVQNSAVRGALTQITKQNFGYNESDWIAWYARVYAAPARDLRRDP